jgi:hypothetical protein
MGKGSRRSKSMSDQRGSQKEDKQEQQVLGLGLGIGLGCVIINLGHECLLHPTINHAPLPPILTIEMDGGAATLRKHERRGRGTGGRILLLSFLGSNFLFGLLIEMGTK